MPIFKLFFESVFYTILLLLIVAAIIYGVSVMHDKGTSFQAPSYCESNTGKVLKIKKIISVDNTFAKVEMEDDNIYDYQVKKHIRNYKGGGTITYKNIKVGDMICVDN